MSWTLSRKVLASLLAILVGMMAATSYFAYSKLEDMMAGMVRSRYGVVVDAIRRSVEDRIALGIPLYQQRSVQDQLERYKGEDKHILEIMVFNGQGEVLFDSDRSGIGARIPAGWLRLGPDSTRTFADEIDDGRIVGASITGTFGQAAGGIALRYPTSYLERSLGPVIGHLAAEVGWLVLGFGIAAAVGARLLLRPVISRLKAMEDSMTDLVAGNAPAEETLPDYQDRSFEGYFQRFLWRTREVMNHLSGATNDVERLDRLA